MKLIIWDEDNDYVFDDIPEESLEYFFEYYKEEYNLLKTRLNTCDNGSKKFDLVMTGLLFLNLGIAITVLPKFIPGFLDHMSLDQYNIFNNNTVIVSEMEVNDIYDEVEDSLGIELDAEEDVEEYLLFDAVNKNKNLTEEEKSFCYKYIDMFKENPYLNKEDVYFSLLNVEVFYSKRPFYVKETIHGRYLDYTKNIDIYGEDETKSVLAHELIHCIYGNKAGMNLPRFFYEGMTELLTEEYFPECVNKDSLVYPFEVSAVKMLCNLTSSDTVLKAFTYGDMSYITKELAENLDSYEEAEEVIDILSTVIDEHHEEKELSYTEDEIVEKCISKLQICINTKLSDDKIEDIMSYYSNELLFNNLYKQEIGYTYAGYVHTLDGLSFNNKVYFSSKLKESMKEIEKTLQK